MTSQHVEALKEDLTDILELISSLTEINESQEEALKQRFGNLRLGSVLYDNNYLLIFAGNWEYYADLEYVDEIAKTRLPNCILYSLCDDETDRINDIIDILNSSI